MKRLFAYKDACVLPQTPQLRFASPSSQQPSARSRLLIAFRPSFFAKRLSQTAFCRCAEAPVFLPNLRIISPLLALFASTSVTKLLVSPQTVPPAAKFALFLSRENNQLCPSPHFA
jgi:hypothetical protein